jgi:hypothetical protein
MAVPEQLPSDVPERVQALGVAVTSEEVDSYGRYREIQDRSFRLRTVVSAWESQQTEERRLRRSYGTAILIALCVQTLLVDAMFILMGVGKIAIAQWVANIFIVSVFGQIVALAVVVVRHLFPQPSSEILRLIERI